jgi:hypothetical protein
MVMGDSLFGSRPPRPAGAAPDRRLIPLRHQRVKGWRHCFSISK